MEETLTITRLGIEVQGYRGVANLAVAIEHDLLAGRQQAGHATVEEEAAALTV